MVLKGYVFSMVQIKGSMDEDSTLKETLDLSPNICVNLIMCLEESRM
jgi:hypothetical protein